MNKPRCPGKGTQYWTPDDIFEVACPHCGEEMEFFKDDPTLDCPACHQAVKNPKTDLGCKDWCKHGKDCAE